jgi:AhpD family alkylhydroperoxidase
MCCSTGICGPSVDPQLVRFAADLDWLKAQGIAVERFNLSQQPAAFAEDAAVKAALEANGEAGLPLVKVNGEVKSSGVFPSRDELAAWAGLGGASPSLYTAAVAELVAIGASVASGCDPCLEFHQNKARKLGVSAADLERAVGTGQRVKAAKTSGDQVEREIYGDADADPAVTAPKAISSGCCGPAVKPKSGGCC